MDNNGCNSQLKWYKGTFTICIPEDPPVGAGVGWFLRCYPRFILVGSLAWSFSLFLYLGSSVIAHLGLSSRLYLIVTAAL